MSGVHTPGLQPEIDRTRAALDVAHTQATSVVEDAQQSITGPGLFENVSRSAIGIAVIAVWAVAVLWYIGFVLTDVPDFVCSVPGDNTAETYTGVCENGRSSAIEQMKDIVLTFILPVVTLVLGYYFGKLAGSSDENI